MPSNGHSEVRTQSLWGQAELLRPDQFDRILAQAPVAYLPWGAIEYHSYHNPIGLDGLKAHGLLRELAQRTGGVVFPPVYAGHATIKTILPFNHSVEFSAGTLRAMAAEWLRQLADLGFKVIVLLTGHYSGAHVDALAETGRAVEGELDGVTVRVVADREPLDGRYPANHAARGETSFQMYFDASLVDLSLLPKDRCATLEGDGVWGEDPRLATAGEGADMVRLFLDVMVPQVKEMLAASRGRDRGAAGRPV